MRIVTILLALTMLCAPARAEWYEASSDYFVVYADDDREDVREFTTLLERFHSAISFVTGQQVAVPSPSNRVTIVAVGNRRDVQKLFEGKRRNIAGFYLAKAGGSVAFVQDIKLRSRKNDFSLVILLHEYAHHFFVSGTRTAIPWWMREGSAEFFSSTRFFDDGTMQIGRPADHRIAELKYGSENRVEDLLDPEGLIWSDSSYGWAWKLFHHLTFAEHRSGQLAEYARLVTQGTEQMEAAKKAFGPLDTLHREITDSFKSTKSKTYTLTAAQSPPRPVALRKLTPGEADAMPYFAQLLAGLDEKEATRELPEIRALSELHADNAQLLATLSAFELEAGEIDAALASAERAIAANPKHKLALVRKGEALFAKAAAADAATKEAAYAEAMQPFSALNALEADHPIPLIRYYDTFSERDASPNDLARHALERAGTLAPFDHWLWLRIALLQAREGKIELAKASLGPIAGNPHGEKLTEKTKEALEILGRTSEGTRIDLAELVEFPDPEEAGEDEILAPHHR